MRNVDQATLDALRGSRAGDKVTVFVWYNGNLAYPEPLPISSYSFDWDITRQIQTFSCQVTDKDGVLAPWLLEDPLGVGGSLLQVRYQVGSAGIINMGWYRVARNTPDERWRSYLINNLGAVHTDSEIPPGKDLVYVSGGAGIAVTAYDLASVAKRARLLAPESPPSTSLTIVSEVTRLMRDIAPVVTTAGVTDRNVSRNIIYDRERLDAVQDLCKRIFCDYRMNGDGQLEIYPVARQAPVATLEGGPGGLLVKVDRAQDWEGLYNQFVVDGTKTGTDGSTTPIRAVRQIETGALSVFGPHGRVPEFYSSTMIQTQEDADAYAYQMMVTQLSGLTVDLLVTALPQPYLQQGDWVTVANPVIGGAPVPLVGKIKAMRLSGAGAPKTMDLTVQCSYWDVAAAISGVQRERF